MLVILTEIDILHGTIATMYALFEESGKFLAGRVMSATDSSFQIELGSGKRVKVKAANVLMQFDQPTPSHLVSEAQNQSKMMDTALAWECSPEDEFSFADLAHDYFNDKASAVQQAAALFCLFEAPHYFRRAGKGRFKKAAPEIVQQALLGIEKKRQVQLQITEWAQALLNGQCPVQIQEQLFKILFKPDKNAAEYKAVVEAARTSNPPPLLLLQKSGAITSAYQFHWQRFLFDNFPKGTDFPALPMPSVIDSLSVAQIAAFSIDDSATTEIDDALSVQGINSGTVIVGIHIAAPGLAIKPGSDIDKVARHRLSTVYMPGNKITMLPDEIVQMFTLSEGKNCPAISLYVTLNEATLEILSVHSTVEEVPIAVNLRHDTLDTLVTEQWLTDMTYEPVNVTIPSIIDRRGLAFLYKLACHLKVQREAIRGKPETFNRPDYSFKLSNKTSSIPNGDEVVQITPRLRGSPLDLIVAETMILANSTWGNLLAEHKVPGIYRSQASLSPGIKVRMGTKALPHAGIGVASYAWSTSPLRRYTDLVNQWQIICCIKNGQTAPLVAPFKPKDADLFSIISNFEVTYAEYNHYQNGMERYWTLKYIQQQKINDLTATVLKENTVRTDGIPLVLQVTGASTLAKGTKVRIKLGAIDEITLNVTATVIEKLTDFALTDPELSESETDPEDDISASGAVSIALTIEPDEDLTAITAV